MSDSTVIEIPGVCAKPLGADPLGANPLSADHPFEMVLQDVFFAQSEPVIEYGLLVDREEAKVPESLLEPSPFMPFFFSPSYLQAEQPCSVEQPPFEGPSAQAQRSEQVFAITDSKTQSLASEGAIVQSFQSAWEQPLKTGAEETTELCFNQDDLKTCFQASMLRPEGMPNDSRTIANIVNKALVNPADEGDHEGDPRGNHLGLTWSSVEPRTLILMEKPIYELKGQQSVVNPEWISDFIDRVGFLTATNHLSAEIQVHPLELGPIEIKITVFEDQVDLQFLTVSQEIKTLIESTLTRLESTFAQKGLNLGQTSVSYDSSRQQNAFVPHTHAWEEGASSRSNVKSSNESNPNKILESVKKTTLNQVDYYV